MGCQLSVSIKLTLYPVDFSQTSIMDKYLYALISPCPGWLFYNNQQLSGYFN